MLSDSDIDHIVRAFVLPPPYGFTESEKKDFLKMLKASSIFLDIPKAVRKQRETKRVAKVASKIRSFNRRLIVWIKRVNL